MSSSSFIPYNPHFTSPLAALYVIGLYGGLRIVRQAGWDEARRERYSTQYLSTESFGAGAYATPIFASCTLTSRCLDTVAVYRAQSARAHERMSSKRRLITVKGREYTPRRVTISQKHIIIVL